MYRSGQNTFVGEHLKWSLLTAVLSPQEEETHCSDLLPLICAFIWLEEGWRMLFKRDMRQLPLFLKALPFLVHRIPCLINQVPGRNSVLHLLLLIAHFSVYCSEMIKILRVSLQQVCQESIRLQGPFLILVIIRLSCTIQELCGFSLDFKADTDAEYWRLVRHNHPVRWECHVVFFLLQDPALQFAGLLPCIWCLLGRVFLHYIGAVKLLDKDVCSKDCSGCINTCKFGSQRPAGIRYLRSTWEGEGGESPKSYLLLFCSASPGSWVQKHCPCSGSGWTTGKWRTPVINTGWPGQDVQIGKEHKLPCFSFFLICYCLKRTLCFPSWCHFSKDTWILWFSTLQQRNE